MTLKLIKTCWITLAVGLFALSAFAAGPYSSGFDDPENPWDAPIPGWIGPDGLGRVTEANRGNPIFVGWASVIADYSPVPDVVDTPWLDPSRALGPATGNFLNIVSLGDLDAADLAAGVPPGTITLTFSKPIRNFSGADFVVFENTFASGGETAAESVFAELAFVEVSSDGEHFARFPSVSLTPDPLDPFAYMDPRKVFNLAGKHVNSGGGGIVRSWGTPFSLSDLADHPKVLAGTVNLDAISHVRLVDIPGDGSFTDSLGNPIYDPWPTIGSGGFDLEAIGVISHELDFASWREVHGSPQSAEALPDDLLRYATGAASGVVGLPEQATRTSLTQMDGAGASLPAWSFFFYYDERATDVVLTVEHSPDLLEWTAIARRTGAGPLAPVDGLPDQVEVSDSSAATISSIAVIRKAMVTIPAELFPPSETQGFFRLAVEVVDE